VTDASALVEFLLRTPRAFAIESVLRSPGADLRTPALCDVEIAAALSRAVARGLLSEGRALQAIADYLDLPLTRHGHQGLMPRMFALRANFSAYDAAYAALAERLSADLLTMDAQLGRAVRTHVGIQVLSP